MEIINNKDRFGYYTVGGLKTYSKIEALEAMRRTNVHVEWHFLDHQWSTADWLTEPVSTLSELYAQRARQIRSKYDHVVLMYSGGIDSQNILDTFVANGIHFDEVATMNYNKADPRPMSYFHAEQTIVSYPYLKMLKDRGFNFKHRSIDLTDITYNLMNDKEMSENYVYYNNVGWGWNRLAKGFMRTYCQDWKNLIAKGKRLALVWGTDKPRIYLQDGRFCFKFIDIVIDTAVTGWTQIRGDDSEHDEFFYWSQDLPEIVIKQSHVIRKFLRDNPQLIAHMQTDKNNGTRHINVNDNSPVPEIGLAWGWSTGMSWRDCVCKLIYPYFDHNTFNNGKGNGKFGGAIYSARDEVWLKDHEFKKSLVERLNYLNTIDDYWKNNPEDIHDGVKGCITQPYWIEPACDTTSS